MLKAHFFLLSAFRNERIARLYYHKMHLEVCFSWLSTLGGACATLGDKYKNFVSIRSSIRNEIEKIRSSTKGSYSSNSFCSSISSAVR